MTERTDAGENDWIALGSGPCRRHGGGGCHDHCRKQAGHPRNAQHGRRLGRRTVTEKDLLGKPSVIFFGFTYCPDVCPTTLFELTALAEQLGPDADRINLVFISVDAERDGPTEMKQYLEAFDDRIIGLTGTDEQIDAAAKAYKIYYSKVPLERGDYTMDHTASVILMDADGRFFGTIDYEEDSAMQLAKLKRLIAEQPAT